MPTKNHLHTYIIAIHPVHLACTGSRQLKQPVKPDEETIILLTEQLAAHHYYDSLARLSMRQTTLGGVDERLNSVRADRERERQRTKGHARIIQRATAQERNSILCLPLFAPVILVVLVIMLFLPLLVKARSTARESIFGIFESLLSGCKMAVSNRHNSGAQQQL